MTKLKKLDSMEIRNEVFELCSINNVCLLEELDMDSDYLQQLKELDNAIITEYDNMYLQLSFNNIHLNTKNNMI